MAPYARQGVDLSLPHLHVVESAAPVQKQLYPEGEIVDSHENRHQLWIWARQFMEDNPNVARSYVIDNPLVEGAAG